MESNYRIFNGDCLEIMKQIPDNSIDLILIDPPYNIKKAEWDTWKSVESYVEFMGKVFKELERVLKNNGSFYFFHNDFLQIVELQNYINKNTSFKFKQLLVWTKRFEGSSRKYYFDNVISGNSSRNHRLLSEYCLFYTFQDETGLSKVLLDTNNFKPLREYFKYIQSELKVTKKEILEKVGQGADHCFRHSSSQWSLPTPDTYNALINCFNIDRLEGFKDYNTLRKDYNTLRAEYESQRYTFKNLKTHHDVLTFDVAPRNGHLTPKPVELIEYLIKTSSNEGDLVLDCFLGSGTTGVACLNTNRRFIGIEKEPKYFEIAKQRLEEVEENNNGE